MFAKKHDGVSLKSLCVWIIMAALILSGLIFNATFRLTSTFENLTEATESQIALGKASHELMDASDYLTEKVQRFTVNGDLHFLEDYFKEAFETNRRESAIAKLSANPNTAAALEKLQQALDESVSLMNREYYAMRLVVEAKGYTDYPRQLRDVTLEERDRELSPQEKMRRATEMVLDDEYYAQKERILQGKLSCNGPKLINIRYRLLHLCSDLANRAIAV